MTKATAFWDASALVPLCVHETTSRDAQAQLRAFLPVVWWGTLVEIHSAIRRAHLLGKLIDQEKANALSRLELLSRGWREISPDDALRDLARQLLDAHDLRAADSVRLAAALVWCQHRSARRSSLSRPPSFRKREGSRFFRRRTLVTFQDSLIYSRDCAAGFRPGDPPCVSSSEYSTKFRIGGDSTGNRVRDSRQTNRLRTSSVTQSRVGCRNMIDRASQLALANMRRRFFRVVESFSVEMS